MDRFISVIPFVEVFEFQEKSTPLLVAVTNMQTKAALALLEGKADVNVRNFVGGTPLMIAAGVGEVIPRIMQIFHDESIWFHVPFSIPQPAHFANQWS